MNSKEKPVRRTGRPFGDMWSGLLDQVPKCIFCRAPRGIRCDCCNPEKIRLIHTGKVTP